MFEPVITIDLDWAPDYMIEPMAAALIERGVRATWLVTHASPAVEALRERPDLFELGIHPNFQPGSSHGATPEEVIDHCMSLVPSARCVRTHGLVQSTRLLHALGRREELCVDLSLYLHHCPSTAPCRFAYRGARLLRLPHVWEDDFEMECADASWRLEPILRLDGLKILDFHPVHVFLNCPTGEAYDACRRLGPVNSIVETEARAFKRTGLGPAIMFAEAVDHLADRGGGERIGDLAARIEGLEPDRRMVDPARQNTA